ncbi:hypothetical protein GCM10008018_56010 [Paenibacillus marchantiophytorum]|uniref:Uncharacterized protein n=1 Tax=Paenibacillus marchantiophytorum TaxID=1619310 RepID=A0ABQ1F7R3_9BACL|nr:hypothetical protein GCM10008018_56010 [Paenibacillus marchantiophytorum]
MSDRRVLKLIWKWLKAGFVKDDQFYETDLGNGCGTQSEDSGMEKLLRDGRLCRFISE